jgi:hypothetical protein
MTKAEKVAAQAFGKVGGRTRARNLPARERSRIAKAAALARWGGPAGKARRAKKRAANMKQLKREVSRWLSAGAPV